MSSTTTVFLVLGLKDSLSRKSATISEVMLSLEVKPSWRLSLVVIPKILSPETVFLSNEVPLFEFPSLCFG